MKGKGIRIYKGSLTAEQLAQIKEAVGTTLFYTVTEDNKGEKHYVVFRPIFAPLYRKIQNLVDESRSRGGVVPQGDIDELIFEECLVWPELTNEERANLEVQVVPTFSKAVQEKSGFTEIDVFGNWIGPTSQVVALKDYNHWPDYTLEEAEAIKASTPFQLFRLRIDRWIFIVRPLTTQDVRIAQTQPDNSLTLATATVMWPPFEKIDWSTVPAGIVDTVANVATKVSGWDVGDVEITEL